MFYWFPFVIISYGGHGIAKGTFVSLEGKTKLPLCGKRRRKKTNLPSSLHQSKASKPDWKGVFLKSCNISAVESLRKHGQTSLWHQVAGATCYYHGDTTQRGILQILIQGSIFIDGDAIMQHCRISQVDGTPCNWNLPFPCPAPTILSVGAFGK